MELKNKKTILIFVDWYVPGYKAGGPIKSVYSLVHYLKKDFNFRIITSDTDFGETEPYPNVESNKWIETEDSVSVFYASKDFLSRKNILKLTREVKFDVIYLNSFFSVYFSLIPLLFCKLGMIRKPVVLAPRGMLGSGALRLKSGKKKIFIALSKLIRSHKNINWHATSDQEREEIKKIFGDRSKITVVPNLQYTSGTIDKREVRKEKGKLRLFFLSRISEKKNLLFALEILLKLKLNTDEQIAFDIYGPVEDEAYWNKCKALIEKLKQSNVDVNYKGGVRSEEVSGIISAYHFLILPTFNENYGHVIVESFSNGKPVIISDQTPWRELEDKNVGWDIPLNNISKFEQVLNECISMDAEGYRNMSANATVYAEKYCNSENSVQHMQQMFKDAVNE